MTAPSNKQQIKQIPGCAILLKTVQLIMAVTIFCSLNAAVDSAEAAEAADLNVLVIGSDHDPRNLFSGPSSKAAPFLPGGITSELQQIVSGAGLGSVNVQFEQYFAENGSAKASNLASWFHWPYPADVETTTRWPNLRGENGTEWDYIILIGDPHTIEYTPGMYAQGVAKIAAEVAKSSNPAEVILLMPWPGAGSSSSVAHYKEVVYRVGRSGGLKVAPAALAWEAAGSPAGDTHPSTNGAYIAAASVYTRIWGKSAAESSYNPFPAVAATVQNTVTANIGVQQYTGKFSFQNPYLMLDDKRRSIFFEHRGSSTENGVQMACRSAIAECKIGFEAGAKPYAWNHGRQGSSKSYRIDASQWQLAFGYWFRSNTWGQPIPTANDIHIGQIHQNEYKFANLMRTRGSTARVVPWRLLWAQLHQVYPDLNPIQDNAGHLSYGHGFAISRYMYTLYSGRCPLGVKPSPMTANWQAQKIGYETAWRVGRCQMRAPGFKVIPSSVNAHTVTPTTAETMSVQFILPPEKPVTVQVSVSNAAAIVNPKYLTFTPSNYDTAQFVHVQGLPGASASEPFAVQFDTVSEDVVYHELNDSWSYATERSSLETVTVTVIDQADRSLTIPNRNATMIPLNVSGSVPSNTTFSHPLHGSISWFGENVIYTPAVDFVGTDSFSFAVNQGGTLTRGHVTITLEDVPQLLFSESGLNKDTIVTEGGTTDSYTVALSQAPASEVTVSLVPDSQMTVSAPSLLFTTENWNEPQTVTVTAVDDTDLEPCYFGALTHSLSSDDLNWNDVSNNLPVSVFDNDTSYPLTVVNGSGDGSYVPGTGVAITADPPAENYHFDKWISWDGKIISDLTASDNYSMLGYATTITATYALDTYHLSFDQQGGDGGSTTATATYSKAMPLATVPTRTGYLFRGYFSETFGEGTQYYTYQMQSANNWDVTADTVLYAHWSPFHSLIQEDFESPVVSSYAQGSFPDNGQWVMSASGHGSSALGLVNKDGNNFSAPDPNHQAFACRDSNTGITTAEGVIGSLEGGATYRITVDVVRDVDDGTLYNAAIPYTIAIIAFDSGAVLDDVRPGLAGIATLASYNGNAPLDSTFETVSFEFAADPDSHAAQIGKSLAVRFYGGSHSASYDNVIVEKISPPFKHQLNYDDNGADSGAIPVGITEFHPGEAVTVLGNTGSLSKESFTFVGWNTAANGTGLAYTSDDTFYISNDTTLYAQWYNPTASTIQYIAGTGGSISGATTQLILPGNNGTSVTAVPDPSHNFEQWSDGSTTATRQESSVSSNVTLNASFLIKTYTVNYHANDGSGSISEENKTHGIDGVLSDGSALMRSGYIFSGWATEIDGGGTAYAGRDVYATDADLNLYAQWLPSETLLTEGFESPVVSGWAKKTKPDNGNWISPTDQDGYGWSSYGLVNEDSGYFSNADVSNNQAFRVTYGTRTGITSADGAIEALEEDTTYVVEFTAVKDSLNSGRKYNVQLIAFDEGADRSPTSTIPAGSHLLSEATGEASTGGGIDYVRFTFSSDAHHAAMVGMDLSLRIRSTSSEDMAIIDDVRISKILPDPNLPVIVAMQATGITATSAQLEASLTSAGTAATTVSCYWSANNDPGETTIGWDYSTDRSVATATQPYTTDTADTAPLLPGTTYTYRYRAENSFGTSWSDPVSFTTPIPPVVNTGLGAVSSTTTSATLTGELTSGESAEAWICWGTTDGGTASTSDWDHVVSLSTVNQGVAFSTLVSGLTTNVSYWYRCYASNAGGTDWSDEATSFSGGGGTGSHTHSFQEGVSPTGAYVAPNTWLRSGVNADTAQDDDPDDETIVGWASGEMRPLFAFDLTEVETVAAGNEYTIDAVRLVVTSRGANQGGSALDMDLHQYDYTFVEADATWNDPDGVGGGDATAGGTLGTIVQSLSATPTSVVGGDTLSFTNSAAFRAAVTNALTAPDNTLRLLLKGDVTAGGNVFIRLYDETYATASYRPELVVEFTVSSGGPIANLAPTAISDNAATFNASLNALDTNYDVTVFWGTTDGSTDAGAWEFSQDLGNWSNVTAKISHAVNSLNSGTTYFYTFRAKNDAGDVWATPSWQFSTAGTNQSPFGNWVNSGGLSDDNNSDGLSNGIAWVLGAADPSADATALLPVAENNGDPAYFVFQYRRSDEAHNDPGTTILSEYSIDLNTWLPCIHDGDNIIITEIDEFYGTGVDKVEVKLKRAMAPNAGIFTRLKVSQ